MKAKLLFLFFGVFSAHLSFCQDELDEVFSLLKIDAKIESINKYLIQIDQEEWNDEALEMQGYITSGWIFDFKKAGVETYFGLNIQRIEVYMDQYDEGKEDIYSFQIYLEKPKSEDEETDFVLAHFERFGDAMSLDHPETGLPVSLTWFSSITLLTLSLGVEVETGLEQPYFVADFHQAYGG